MAQPHHPHPPWFDERARAALDSDLATLELTQPHIAAAARRYLTAVEEVLGEMDCSPEASVALRAYLTTDAWRQHVSNVAAPTPSGSRR